MKVAIIKVAVEEYSQAKGLCRINLPEKLGYICGAEVAGIWPAKLLTSHIWRSKFIWLAVV